MMEFMGPNKRDQVHSFRPDNAGELIKAAKSLGWLIESSTPHRSTSNAIAERAVRRVLDGARTLQFHGGMPRIWWPYAAKHYCWLHNVMPRKGRPSPYFLRHKHNFKGILIPFAALVEYIPNKAKARALPKFDTATRPGLMLGYHVHPGGRWSKDYLICLLYTSDAADD